MANDLSIVLSSDVSELGKRAFVNLTLWNWSVHGGKYTTRLRSSIAHAAILERRRVALRHDHAVPRKLLIERIMANTGPSKSDLYSFLKEFCVGVTITKDEDTQLSKCGLRSRMPKDWAWADVRARYSVGRIEIVEADDS
jgi:hypothetical protein